ncbi:DUF368 domain-containing protein [Candidatus Nomurabacteria bacterium]|nr:DUF368 domain-containing protein [Candidatus Nomurabacteria bacterium]
MNISLRDKPILKHIIHILQGAIVGAGAILPGVSGGVLCVSFGIYQPMMALFSHPVKSFRKYYSLFIPFLAGWLAGFIFLAKVVELLFNASSVLAIALFVGLIGGTLPGLFREAGSKGSDRRSWTGFVLGMILLFTFLSVLNNSDATIIEADPWWFAFCGAVWGLSLVIPGLSSSSILIFMGLYQPMTSGIAALDFGVILPLLAGLAFTVILTARFVNNLYEKHFSLVSHTILGIVIASTLLILPEGFSSLTEILLAVICFSGGFLVSYFMDRSKV